MPIRTSMHVADDSGWTSAKEVVGTSVRLDLRRPSAPLGAEGERRSRARLRTDVPTTSRTALPAKPAHANALASSRYALGAIRAELDVQRVRDRGRTLRAAVAEERLVVRLHTDHARVHRDRQQRLAHRVELEVRDGRERTAEEERRPRRGCWPTADPSARARSSSGCRCARRARTRCRPRWAHPTTSAPGPVRSTGASRRRTGSARHARVRGQVDDRRALQDRRALAVQDPLVVGDEPRVVRDVRVAQELDVPSWSLRWNTSTNQLAAPGGIAKAVSSQYCSSAYARTRPAPRRRRRSPGS